MAYTAADASQKVTLVLDPPEDLLTVTAADLNAGLDIHNDILKTDFQATATDSTTHNDTPLGSKGQWPNFAGRNANASVTVLRDLDETGRPDAESSSETTFAAVREPGTRVGLFVRKGPDPDEDWQDDDEVRWGGVVQTDVPREPSDPNDGFIKVVVPLGVQDFETYFNVAAVGV
ncbi:hypothetical protein [Pseudactinotalea sp. Z1748]|uniref:phage tail tube protein n=1 Tax=Pseudactinotalea sp. Z1748 TaxID=3413027 RepID=UPI003C7CCC04